MTNKATKYGLMTIAAVLLVAMAFAGAGAAETELTDALVQTYEGILPTGEYILNDDVTLTTKNIHILTNNVVTIDLNGHTLIGNGDGRVITLDSTTSSAVQPTKLTIKDSSGVNDGKIIGGNGGGIFAQGYTHLYFEGGNITGNTVATTGAGITTATGTRVFMSGGIITNNTATNGGGLWIGNAYFTMTGGEITNNIASEQGGGIWFAGSNHQELHLAGGKVTGNKAVVGSGIYIRSDSNDLYLRGNVNVSGNINSLSSNEENICLSKSQYFTLDGNLEPSSTVNFTIEGKQHFLNGMSYSASAESLNIDNLASSEAVHYRSSNNNWFIEPKELPTDGPFSSLVAGKIVYYSSLDDALNNLPTDTNTIYCENDTLIESSATLQFNTIATLTAKNLVTLTCSVTPFVTDNNAVLTIKGPIVFDGDNNVNQTLSIAASTVNLGVYGEKSGFPKIKNFGKLDSVIIVGSSGVCNLYDCTIEENVAYVDGNGLIYVNKGSVNQYAGCSIKNNSDTGYIINFDTNSGGTYSLYGGTIEDNKESVIVIGGTKGSFYQYGGEIKNNSGLVTELTTGNDYYYLYGGSITGNENGGISIGKSGTRFYASGSPVVKDNTVGDADANVMLIGSQYVKLKGPLTAGADIGVNVSSNRAIVIGDGYVPTASDLQYFISDIPSTRAFYYQSTDHKIYSGSPSVAITLHSNNGTDITDTQYVVSNKETPVKDNNFIFADWFANGWNTEADGTGIAYAGMVTITSPLELYAQWTAKLLLDSDNGNDGIVNVTYANTSLTDYVTATKDGYGPEGYYADTAYTNLVINISDQATPKLEKDVPGFTDVNGKWTNPDGSATVLYVNWTLNTTTVTASEYKAEFGNDNVTAIHSTEDNVIHVHLENVSNVADSAVKFTADNTTVPFNFVGYNKDEIAVFEINASAVGTAKINLTVTFKDVDTANAKKDNVSFFHYNVSAWEPLNSTIASQTGADVLYTVETTSFSLFGIGIFTPITYTVRFDANGGQGSMADMTFTYDEGQNLTANAFHRYNSNFLYWTCNGTKYYNTDFVQNLTIVDGDTVEMVAQWEGYSTGGSSSGSTYLDNNDVSIISTQQPTQQPTVAPTVAPTVKPTEKPATPTVIATAKPTTQPTQQSPAPFVGLLAGLGAAAVLLRLRK